MNRRKIQTIRRATIAVLSAAILACGVGLLAACSEEETVTYTQGEDSQLVKNGSFEYFDIPDDAVYLIKNPNDWTKTGNSSTSMSGIISTSYTGWGLIADEELRDKLDYNNDLDVDDDNYADEYIDYNGMTSSDILYKDNYAATLEKEDVAESFIASYADEDGHGYEGYFSITEENGEYFLADGTKVYKSDDEDDPDYYFDEALTENIREERISNPGTHYDIYDKDGNLLYDEETCEMSDKAEGLYMDVDGEQTAVYVDDVTGDYFYLDKDYADEFLEIDENFDSEDANEVSDDYKIYVSNILMIHNTESTNNGIDQAYSSSTSITLPANTAAEISVWVKTANLKFDKGYDENKDEGRGAYIEVAQTVSGNEIDSFKITAINTDKILSSTENEPNEVENSNGWLQYTIYVNACDFADSTVTINLGLGGDTVEAVSGYAFFDDVVVTQYIDWDDAEEQGSSFNEIREAGKLSSTTCNLTADRDDKIFYADCSIKEGDPRNSKDLYYYIDLASESDMTNNRTGGESNNGYEPVVFGDSNTSASLTVQDDGKKQYVCSETDNAYYNGIVEKGYSDYDNLQLPKTLNESMPTGNDMVGIFDYGYDFDASDFGGNDYSTRLNNATENVASLPKANNVEGDGQSNMIAIVSGNGAAYTATVADDRFTLGEDEYAIVSFWVKTSDMRGQSAATIKIYDADDEDDYASLTVESTDVTTDIGDHEDIYDEWVQCFFFVHNDASEYDEGADHEKSFKIDFSFGNTTIDGTDVNSYYYGWAILANMQILSVDEDVYNLTSSDTYSALYALSDPLDDDKPNAFDEEDFRSDIKTGIADASSYTGVNGGSSTVTDADYDAAIDAYDTNSNAGLINAEYFDEYAEKQKWDIIYGFTLDTNYMDAIVNWNDAWSDVFGNVTYQPLIIIDNLRTYASLAEANDETYKLYYVLAEEGYTGKAFTDNSGKIYRKVTEGEEFDEELSYYSLTDIVNYGYVGSSSTISANSYTTISVNVMVSGDAVAHIYLIDPDTNEILGYETPEYSFYYDENGNVLDEEYDSTWSDREHRRHIVYEMRDDGLYENYRDSDDENLYANIYNLTNTYDDSDFEHESFYELDDDGNYSYISFDDLEKGETYYTLDENDGYVLASHFLTTTDGVRVYEYSSEYECYYYLVDEEYTYKDEDDEEQTAYHQVRGDVVIGFDKEYARDYDQITKEETPYHVTVVNTNGEWVTVNFIIHTGSESITYRLELWSGERDSYGEEREGAVAFDYSAYSISESTYSSLISEYEGGLIEEMNKILQSEGLLSGLKSASENLNYYAGYIEEKHESGELSNDAYNELLAIEAKYTAYYYTFSLYDSSNYVPWNATTADDGETGYYYDATDYVETLAYFEYKIMDGDAVTMYNIFYNYAPVDTSVEIGTVNASSDEEEESETSYEVWLLITSIILSVVLIITLIIILIRTTVRYVNRRRRGAKHNRERNVYKRRERYIRRLHLDADAPEAGDGDGTQKQ